MTRSLMLIPALAAIAVLPAYGQTQQQRSGQVAALEEVIVTAQRREETAQRAALSVSVLSESDIQKRGIANVNDLMADMPGVGGFETPGGRGATTLSIRGLTGGSPLNGAVSAAVATYIDGVYLGKQRSSAVDVANIQRIEVLRGPQGTLYGKNSTGGAVNFITAPPTGEFGFKVTGTLGDYDQREIKVGLDTATLGDVSDPMGQLSASLGYQKRERDGFYRNTASGDPDFMDLDREAYRLALDWQLNESTLFAYRYDNSTLDETNNLEKVIGFVPLAGGVSRIDAMQGVLTRARGWALIPGSDPRIPQRLIPSLETSIAAYMQVEQEGRGRANSGGADHMPVTTADVEGHSLTFSTDLGELGFLGEVTLKSITAYREITSKSYGDIESFDSRLDANGVGLMNDTLLTTFGQLYGPASGFAYPLINNVWNAIDDLGAFHTTLDTGGSGEEYEQFSQEIQFIGTTERTEYILGLYYFDDKTTSATGPDEGAIYLAPLSGGGRATSSKDTSESVSIFGQTKWTPGWMNDQFSITAGLRYTKEEKETEQFQARQVTVFGVNPESTYADDVDFDDLSVLLTLGYEFSDTVSSFLRYSTGFRSGGFNSGVFGTTFDDESIEQLELGLKSEWYDRRLRVNAAIYAYKWDDGQISTIVVTEDRRALSGIGNGGAAERWGGELEIQALPVDDLLLSLSYAFIDGDYDDYPDVCGTKVPQVCLKAVDFAKRPSSPDNSLSASADYVFMQSEMGTLRGFVQINWQDEYNEIALWSGVVAGDPIIYDHIGMSERTIVNARLSLEEIPAGNGSLMISLWGKNLTDNDYPLYGINLGALGLITEQYGDPRTYGLDVTYAF